MRGSDQSGLPSAMRSLREGPRTGPFVAVPGLGGLREKLMVGEVASLSGFYAGLVSERRG